MPMHEITTSVVAGVLLLLLLRGNVERLRSARLVLLHSCRSHVD